MKKEVRHIREGWQLTIEPYEYESNSDILIHSDREFRFSPESLNSLTNYGRDNLPDDRLVNPIQETLHAHCFPHQLDRIATGADFSVLFDMAQEFSLKKYPALPSHFSFGWEGKNWFSLRARHPSQDEVSRYYNEPVYHRPLFESSFGGFNLFFVEFRCDGKLSEFVMDAYWWKKHPEVFLLHCLLGKYQGDVMAFREAGGTWQQGLNPPNDIDIPSLQRATGTR